MASPLLGGVRPMISFPLTGVMLCFTYAGGRMRPRPPTYITATTTFPLNGGEVHER